jgi:histidine triad (HIT) family protein
MNDCLFCKIVNGEVPSTKVYEDENVYAFLDINPINPGHTLLIPKRHCDDLLKAPGEDLRNLVSVAPRIAEAIIKSLDYKGFILSTNNGGVAGQEVMHLHFHIIPRSKDDGHRPFERRGYEENQMTEVAQKITNLL